MFQIVYISIFQFRVKTLLCHYSRPFVHILTPLNHKIGEIKVQKANARLAFEVQTYAERKTSHWHERHSISEHEVDNIQYVSISAF